MRVLLLLLMGVGWSLSASSADIGLLTVARVEQSFIARATFIIDLPQDEVVSAFRAVDQLTELNPAILSSNAEIRPDGAIRLSIRLRDCVAFFCRSVALVEDIHFDGQDSVRSNIVPELSDFKHGTTTWHFTDLGQQTQVSYESRVTPDFWLPPVIGPYAIRETLKRQIGATISNLESLVSRH